MKLKNSKLPMFLSIMVFLLSLIGCASIDKITEGLEADLKELHLPDSLISNWVAVQTNSIVNVYNGPGSKHLIIGTMLKGEEAESNKQTPDGWFLVQRKDKRQGFVWGEAITVTAELSKPEVPAPAPAPAPATEPEPEPDDEIIDLDELDESDEKGEEDEDSVIDLDL